MLRTSFQTTNLHATPFGLFDRTVCFLLAGGVGSRLAPLTEQRAKPAVPFAGMYRIIDFTLTNCLNSGVRQIYVLTQYKSQSLHRHLRDGWSIFSPELDEFITAVPPQMRRGEDWYAGTADAITQNLYLLERSGAEHVLVLSGDHVYRMDYAAMMDFHLNRNADVTIGCLEVPTGEASDFGVMTVDGDNRIERFDEKPDHPQSIPGRDGTALASMGIYIFRASLLHERLTQPGSNGTTPTDFGHHVVPDLLGDCEAFAFPFGGPAGRVRPDNYWRDVGTLDAYFDAHMDLLKPIPPLDLYQSEWPIRTYHGQHPPARVVPGAEHPGRTTNSIISAGSIISGGCVRHSVFSTEVRVDDGAVVEESILFDRVRVGEGASLRRCIVDKDVVIPPGVRVGYDHEADRQRFTVTDSGITVVPREYIFEEQPAAVHNL